MTDLALSTQRVINAPAAKLFDAWLSAEALQKFMIAGEGMSVSHAETDPREGGRFSIVMAAGDDKIPHAGTYLTVIPHSKIVFTWESPFSAEGSQVTLDFNSISDTKTELTLTHVKFTDEESRDNHTGGWNSILASLDSLVA